MNADPSILDKLNMSLNFDSKFIQIYENSVDDIIPYFYISCICLPQTKEETDEVKEMFNTFIGKCTEYFQENNKQIIYIYNLNININITSNNYTIVKLLANYLKEHECKTNIFIKNTYVLCSNLLLRLLISNLFILYTNKEHKKPIFVKYIDTVIDRETLGKPEI